MAEKYKTTKKRTQTKRIEGFDDYEDLRKLFDKIEGMKEWKEWFGSPCKEFAPLCANCDFWNKWERFKFDVSEGFNGKINS